MEKSSAAKRPERGYSGNPGPQEVRDMVPILLVLLLVLILFGVGFAVEVLWYVALVVLVLWLLGFLVRGTSASGGRGRWYRW
jgi:hypothetical protein